MEDVDETPPLKVDPYQVLEIETTATTNEVKSAYRKLALRHHPDKALPEQRETAHTKFQEIAFAYAILSDERRRRRYDTTGNTSESLDIDDDDFNWLDFFRAQWQETVTTEKIGNFQSQYQHSEEEKRDVLAAYTRFKGDLNKIFNEIMLSDPLKDEDRFRSYVDDAIRSGGVEAYDIFINEPESKKNARIKKAKREAEEAEKHSKEMDLNAKKKGGNKKGAKGGEDSLLEMIQQRQKSRAANFLDDLEARYATPKTDKGKKQNGTQKSSEPPEEAFQQTATRAKKPKPPVESEEEIEDEDEGDDSDDDAFVSEDDEEDERPKKRQRKHASAGSGKKAKGRRKR